MLHSCARDKIKALESFPCVAFASGVSQLEDPVDVRRPSWRRKIWMNYQETEDNIAQEQIDRYVGKEQEDIGLGKSDHREIGRTFTHVKGSSDQSSSSSRTVQTNHQGQQCRTYQDPNQQQVKSMTDSAKVQLRTVLWIWSWSWSSIRAIKVRRKTRKVSKASCFGS